MRRTYFLKCRGCTKNQYLRLIALMDYFLRAHGYTNNARRFKGERPIRFRALKDIEKLYKRRKPK